MKKILSFALALLIVGGSMIACKDKKPEVPDDPETPCTHEDADTDYTCDKCGDELEKPACTQHEDADTDYKCDKCGAELEKPACTQHEDADTDYKCDKCGAELEKPACTQHEDADTDYKCDKCGAELEKPVDPDQPGDEPLEFTEVDEQVKAKVTVELRRAPAADAANIEDVLRVNQIVKRVAISTNGEWSKIYYEAEGLTGYYYVPSICLEVYVEPGQPGSDPSDFVVIDPSETVYVTTNDLNLRAQPSKNGSVVARLAFGTKLERIGKNAEGWSKVVINGNEYYVSSEYLTTEDVTGESFTSLEEPENKTVTADTLKIRTSPWMDDMDENVVGYLRKGDVVKCVAKSPDGYWYRIELTEGTFYYVGALYLSGYVPGPIIPGNPDEPDQPDEPIRPAVEFTTLTEPVLMYAINKQGGVRVYAEPDNLTATVKTLTTGAAVRCVAVSTDGTWYKVVLADNPSANFYIQSADLESGGK